MAEHAPITTTSSASGTRDDFDQLTTNDCDKNEQHELSDDIERIMISVWRAG